MYQLIAENKQGASVRFNGETIRSVINQFDNEYTRRGFAIRIIKLDEENYGVVKVLKNSYR